MLIAACGMTKLAMFAPPANQYQVKKHPLAAVLMAQDPLIIYYPTFQKGLSEMASPSKSSGTSLAGSHERSFGDV